MEKVMVVPTEILEKHLSNDIFISSKIDETIHIIQNNHLYISRDYAETAKEYKQIIPYAVLMNEGRYFLTQRLHKQTEKRLHGLYSIGLGGHINPSEEASENVILEGMRRELFEEVGLINLPVCNCVGIINDHSAEVSNYHLALVFPILAPENIQVRETSKMTGFWATEHEISKHFFEMESWSKIVWESRQYLQGLSPDSSPISDTTNAYHGDKSI